MLTSVDLLLLNCHHLADRIQIAIKSITITLRTLPRNKKDNNGHDRNGDQDIFDHLLAVLVFFHMSGISHNILSLRLCCNYSTRITPFTAQAYMLTGQVYWKADK
jgi:hypothetical protein